MSLQVVIKRLVSAGVKTTVKIKGIHRQEKYALRTVVVRPVQAKSCAEELKLCRLKSSLQQ